MKNFNVLLLAGNCIFVTLFFYCLCSDANYIPDDWIDHTDMRNYDRHTKSMKQSNVKPKHSPLHVDRQPKTFNFTDCSSFREEIERYEIFMERFINHFLQIARINNMKPGMEVSSELVLHITAEELSMLMHFGKKFSSKHLSQFDHIFANIFSTTRQFSFDSLHSYLTPFEQILQSYERITIAVSMIIFGYVLWMFFAEKSYSRIMAFLTLVFFVLGLIWNWWLMYQKAVVDQYVEISKYSDVPQECKKNTQSLSWINFHSILSLFKSTDVCNEYYRAHKIDPFSKVTPSIVFSETVSALFLHPLGKIGAALGEFCEGVVGRIPWIFRVFLLPLVIILVLAFLLLFLSLILGKSLRLWSVFGGFTIGRDSSSSHRAHQSYDTVETVSHLYKAIQQNDGSGLFLPCPCYPGQK